MKAMILAAGQGTRLQPWTLTKPKPAIPFLDIPLAYYSLSLIKELPIHELIVNVHYLPDQVEDLFKYLPTKKWKIHFSDERHQLLGSGGGIHHAKKFLENEKDFLVMNSDEVFLPHDPDVMKNFLNYHLKTKALATLMVMEHPEVGTKFGGAWCSSDHQVKEFNKKQPDPTLKGWHFLGIMLLNHKVFQFFKDQVVDENILYETLTLALGQGYQVQVFPVEGLWFETGNIPDFQVATDSCKKLLQSEIQIPEAQYLRQVQWEWGLCKS